MFRGEGAEINSGPSLSCENKVRMRTKKETKYIMNEHDFGAERYI